MSVNLKDDIKPISYIKTNAADMMKYINENKNTIIRTQHGEAKAALIDIESYQTMKNAFNILKMIQLSEKDIKAGNIKESDQVFDEIKNKFKF